MVYGIRLRAHTTQIPAAIRGYSRPVIATLKKITCQSTDKLTRLYATRTLAPVSLWLPACSDVRLYYLVSSTSVELKRKLKRRTYVGHSYRNKHLSKLLLVFDRRTLRKKKENFVYDEVDSVSSKFLLCGYSTLARFLYLPTKNA